MTDPLPLSLLNDYLYCPRRAALKVVEGWREANVHTDRGDIVHEHSDLAGYESQIRNPKSQILLWRALPVWSERLGLNGKCDIVEVREDRGRRPDALAPGSRGCQSALPSTPDPSSRGGESAPTSVADGQRRLTSAATTAEGPELYPVEFKLGKRRKWDNDDAQLCAQALCLEEMFGVSVPCGAVFHADSKRRREVGFTAELRALTERAIAGLHALLANSEIRNPKSEIPSLPAAIFKPACPECSLYDLCLPRATAGDGRSERLARQLFQI